ncbi:unnamed protein product [Plutella xylostella]|uniref:(diamondback moth) hypothetical protein n=1 Tax=Plutella xylostella TaxID=51655 RepID=A0A8S4G2P2_PLUXY|nr:unnamed protein product [Plutella xylostella]
MSEINTKKTIIDEFLTFVQNKIDIIDDVSLIQICATNFSDAEIDTGKSVLFQEISGARCVNRKGEDKKKKNIKDVIVLLKATDPDVQPTFVAKNLDRLPPVTFDHVDVTRLLKDLTLLKSEMLDLKTNSVSKSEFITLQDELSRLRSRWTPDQTRVAVQKKPFNKKEPSQFNNSNGLTGRSSISTQNSPATASRACVKGDIRAPMLTSSEQDSGPVSEPAAARPPSPESAMPTDDEFVDAEISHTPTYHDILRSEGGTVDRMPYDNKGVNDNGFTTVSHKNLRPVWRSSAFRLQTKIRLFNACVKTVLLYGCETWKKTVQTTNKLQVFVNRCLRNILGIRWFDFVSNEELWRRTHQKPVAETVKERKWRWIAHVLRRTEDVPKEALTWHPEGGKRRLGRPRETWQRSVKKEMGQAGMSWEDVSELAQDRKEWRRFTSALCSPAEIGNK